MQKYEEKEIWQFINDYADIMSSCMSWMQKHETEEKSLIYRRDLYENDDSLFFLSHTFCHQYVNLKSQYLAIKN
jgi:hypothetical protein